MRRCLSLAILALVLADPACVRADPAAPSISPAELEARRATGKAPLVIDVRTPEEFADGHIPGAVNIGYEEVAARMDELDAPYGVALYCMVGPRARKGESALLERGYENVLHIEGGFSAWKQAGLPVSTDPKSIPGRE